MNWRVTSRFAIKALQLLVICAVIGIVRGNSNQQTRVHDPTQIQHVLRQNPPPRNPFLQWLAGLIATTSTTEAPTLEPPTNCKTCKCGRTNKPTRIVGGTETRVNQYPWMAMLQYGGTFYCGGTLISDRHVLTAAHCVHGFNPAKISVVLMEHDRSDQKEAETITSSVIRVIKHNGYNPNNYNSDIALLRLNKTIDFDDKKRPVCMPSKKKSFSGYDGIVTGWGATSENGQISVNLREVTVPIMSNTECRMSGYGETRITENMMCAGYPMGMKDSCQGDSGGPMHVINQDMRSDNIHQIAGIVSWGEGCAKPNYPGVYTRVNRFHTWITTNAADGCFCSEIRKVIKDEPEKAVERQDSAFLEWLELLTGVARPGPPLKPAENCTECKCGRTNQVKRIVGGMETRVNQYPWMAILKYGGSFYCGGTLITDRHVMTAAHCVHGIRRQRITVTLMDHDRTVDEDAETTTAKVERIFKHNLYNPLRYDNDIAILKLDQVITFNDKTRPVCQPSPDESFAGYDAIITGWGTTSQGGEVSSTLLEVTVPVMTNEECRNTSYGESRITDNMLCAGLPDGGKDSCQGDSGGPLHIIDRGSESEMIHQQAGVVSWGEGCAKPDKPGVYTRVNRYLDWIRNNTIDGCHCTQ
ncbi:transmembrane protease serine 9-like [Uranotaenia lowii]|uniref:transmembrane protease serine 9-like n=1 Tax=Uranotaenia lowii TaxID=190385 RepID=UPI002479B2F1|nr:transmembrane protease serine 9-like [Uranotaenia lowii]